MTPKQKRFVNEYLIDLNATLAAKRAGYADGSAKVTGHRLITNVNVAAEIARRQADQVERTEIQADRVVRELARIALGDLRGMFDGERLKSIAELDDAAAACLSSVEVVTRPDGNGSVEYVHKIKAWDKVSALDKLMRHLGAYAAEKHEHTGKDGGPIETKDATLNGCSTEQLRDISRILADPAGRTNGTGAPPSR